jgi:GAF domain-containing protein
MAGDRLLRILSEIRHAEGLQFGPARLCQVCADVVTMTGAGIMLMSDDVVRGSICSSNPVSALIEDLQYTLGEGPCVDAYKRGTPVLEADLAGHGSERWIAFTPPALAEGVRAVFGFPMRVGAVRLGAVNLYRDQPGPLSDDQHADALVMAGVAARTMLGLTAAEIESGSDLRFVVHQASGMVSVQLKVSVSEALIRLRAYAFANNQLLDDVAAMVVSHGLLFSQI